MRFYSVILVCLILISQGALVMPVTAQSDFTSAFIALTFDEVESGDLCSAAVNTYGGFVGGTNLTTDAPVVSGDREAQSCAFTPQGELSIAMGRVADRLFIAYRGNFTVELRLEGSTVLNQEIAGGTPETPATFEEALTYDELRIIEGAGHADSHVLDMAFSFNFERQAADLIDFSGTTPGTPCLVAASFPYLANVEGETVISATTEAGAHGNECAVGPQQVVRLDLTTPANYIEFVSSGSARIELYFNGHLVQQPETVADAGGYFASSIVGFNTIVILTDDSGLHFDNLRLEYPVYPYPQLAAMPGEALGTNCSEFLNSMANMDAVDHGAEALGVPTLENGLCTMPPGSALTLLFERPIVALGFWNVGGIELEVYRDELLIGAAQQLQWPEGYYFDTFPRGINRVILREGSGFSSLAIGEIFYAIQPATGLAEVTFWDSTDGVTCGDALTEDGLSGTAAGDVLIVPTTEDTAFGFDRRCELTDGSSLTINLNRPAFTVYMFMAGEVEVQFLRSGQPVSERVVATGAPFTFNEYIWGGFDQMVIHKSDGSAVTGIYGLEFLYAE